jgi:hypothetical protein
MGHMKLSKHITPFSGSDYHVTPIKFLSIVKNDIDSKLGEEPVEWTVGADPEHVGAGAAANPHRSRDWKNYIKKKQGIMAGYLTGRAQDWLTRQTDANPIYFHNFLK